VINISYYAKKRIKDYLIHFVMLVILVFTLFPICWMIYTSLKENTDILVGKIPLSHAHNNVVDIKVEGKTLWVLTSDGGINNLDRKTLNSKGHVSAQTMSTDFLVDKDYIWVSSANHGLLRYDKNNLKTKKEFDLRLPSFDKAKVGPTTLHSNGNNIYFTMKYKGYEQVVEFNKKTEKISKVYTVKNMFSPSQIQSVLAVGNSLFVGLDTGLIEVNRKSGQIVRSFSVIKHLPLGVERMAQFSRLGDEIIIAGNSGAFLFNIKKGEIVKNVYPNAVYGLNVIGESIYIGTNRGLVEYKAGVDFKKIFAKESLFRQIKQGGTVITDSSFTPSEVIVFDRSGDKLYLGSTYGRLSEYSYGAKKITATAAANPGHLVVSWVNYVDMWKNVDFGLYLRNSFIICGISMFFAMIFATMAAYALSRFDFPGARWISVAILATQMVPGIMFLIPIYSNFVKISDMTGIPIKGTFYGIIFMYSIFFIPFSVWILRGFFAAIPIELEEAARIDGCSPLQVFWHVVLPLAIPGIIATGIYIFLTAWDELIFAWVLTSADTMTIPVGIRNFVGNYQNRFDLIMAAATVATVPVMILFFLLQKHIVKGLTAGAVKG